MMRTNCRRGPKEPPHWPGGFRFSSVGRVLWDLALLFISAVALAVLSACATKAPPALPSALRYQDFMYPAVPPELRTPANSAAIDRGWRFLQNDDLTSADREFATALKR